MRIRLIITLAIVAVIAVPLIYSWGPATGDGTHVGYVTAVEKDGLIFKTPVVYFKTDKSSSQEDHYCATSEVMDQLRAYARSGQRVEVRYDSHAWQPFWRCGPNDTITSVALV